METLSSTHLTYIILGIFLFGFMISTFVLINKLSNLRLNSRRETDSRKLEIPEFEIINIDKTLTSETCRWIAKYTARLCFCNEGKRLTTTLYDVTFFDEIGKYNIGDKLVLNNKKDLNQ